MKPQQQSEYSTPAEWNDSEAIHAISGDYPNTYIGKISAIEDFQTIKFAYKNKSELWDFLASNPIITVDEYLKKQNVTINVSSKVKTAIDLINQEVNIANTALKSRNLSLLIQSLDTINLIISDLNTTTQNAPSISKKIECPYQEWTKLEKNTIYNVYNRSKDKILFQFSTFEDGLIYYIIKPNTLDVDIINLNNLNDKQSYLPPNSVSPNNPSEWTIPQCTVAFGLDNEYYIRDGGPNGPSPEGTIIEKDPQSYQKPEQELPQIKIIPTEEELIQQARQAKINASPPSKNPKFPQNQTPEKEPTPIIKDIITNSTIFQKDHLEVPNKGWTKLDFKSPNEIIRVFTKQGLLMGFIIQIENGIQFISYLQNNHFILTENDPAKIVGRTDIHERPTNKKFSNSQFSLTYQNSSFCIMDGNYQTRAKSTNGTAIDKVTITENSIAQMEHPLLTKLFPQGIDQTTFKQRNIGDCTLLAALIVILKLPYAHKLINNLFNKSIDYHNGNYTILFPHYPDRPIRISEEDLNREAYDDQGNLRQGVESESLGVKLLEVAWGRLIKQEGWADRAHKKSKQRIINNPSDLSSERITNEDQSIATINTMLALHEGHDNKGSNYVLEAIFSDNGRHFVIGSDEFLAEGVSEKTLAESDTSIQIKIIEKLIKHAENPDNMPLIAYTPIREKKFVDDQKRFPRKHAFGILKVDKMQRQVFISNPWDSSSPAEAISFDEFFKYFTALVGTELNDKLSGTSGQNSLAKTIQAKFTKIALIPTPTPSKQETKTTRSWLKKIFRKK